MMWFQCISLTSKKKGAISGFFSVDCAFYLVENQFTVCNFRRFITNIIHSLHPEHHIGDFELLGDGFFFGKVFYQLEKKLLGLFLCISKVEMEFAGSDQIAIQNFAVVL